MHRQTEMRRPNGSPPPFLMKLPDSGHIRILPILHTRFQRPSPDVSEVQTRVLTEGSEQLERYEELISNRQAQSAARRQEKISGATSEKLQPLAQIEEDRQERKMRQQYMTHKEG